MYGRDAYTARFIVELFTIAVPNGSEKEPARMSDVHQHMNGDKKSGT